MKPGQYQHFLCVARVTSRDPERDILVLLLGIRIGMLVSEIAEIEIGDVLLPSVAISPAIDDFFTPRLELRWRIAMIRSDIVPTAR